MKLVHPRSEDDPTKVCSWSFTTDIVTHDTTEREMIDTGRSVFEKERN